MLLQYLCLILQYISIFRILSLILLYNLLNSPCDVSAWQPMVPLTTNCQSSHAEVTNISPVRLIIHHRCSVNRSCYRDSRLANVSSNSLTLKYRVPTGGTIFVTQCHNVLTVSCIRDAPSKKETLSARIVALLMLVYYRRGTFSHPFARVGRLRRDGRTGSAVLS